VPFQVELHRPFEDVGALTAADAGREVWVRARVQNVRAKVG
jgi:hypothetical protein